MIWFFLAGMVAGAVGMMLYAKWWMSRNVHEVTAEEFIDELEKIEEKVKEDESHE